jgi:hypothetical protein
LWLDGMILTANRGCIKYRMTNDSTVEMFSLPAEILD